MRVTKLELQDGINLQLQGTGSVYVDGTGSVNVAGGNVDLADGYFEITTSTAPGNPASGTARIYCDPTTGALIARTASGPTTLAA
jgi:hypothetical protein